jgi:uncharacterized protein (TIGR02996 family)
MGGQLESFLHAIREAPDDDAPRLVLADWFEDHGDPHRAEFIRAQLRLAADLPEDERRELTEQEGALLAMHAERWLGPLAQKPWEVSFRRGTALVKIQASRLLRADVQEQAQEWFAPALVTDLRAEGTTSRWRQLLSLPLLEELSGLVLSGSKMKETDVVTLAECPRLAGLRHLGVRDGFSHSPDRWLSQPGMAALVESPHLRGLTRLDFRRFPLGHEAERLLMKGSRWRLTSLNLDGTMNPRLCEATWLPELKELSLYACMAWQETTVGLVRELAPARLRYLCLGSDAVGDAAAGTIAASAHLAELRELWLTYPRLFTEVGARALADSPYLTKLRLLHIHSMPADSPAGALLRERFGAVARFELLARE